MIDLLRIAIPFETDFVAGSDDCSNGLVDLKVCQSFGAKLEAGDVVYDENGNPEVSSLRSPYQSLASSHSTLSFKIFAGGANYWPFVEIKASPAKLLQGHNVYGSCDIELCVEAMVSTLTTALPKFCTMLDFYSAEIKQIDCTFTAHMPDETTSRNVIHALRNISNGQTRSSKSAHDTTAYFGKGSRHKRLKIYLKHFELQQQIKDALAKYEKTKHDLHLQQAQALQQPSVVNFAKNALRFEASIMPRMFERLGFPKRVGDFVGKCQEFNGCPIQYMWSLAFKDIFESFKGVDMKVYDDEKIHLALRDKFKKETKNGFSYNKADRLFRFFRSIKHEGFEEAKSSFPKNTFYDNLRLLTEVVPKAYLQNLQSIVSNVVPLVRFIDVDFNKQHPENWQEPKPLHEQIQNGLRLVS